MICGTCGTDKERTDGYCINGHDDWIEWSDLLFPIYHDIIERSLDTLNISLPEFVLMLYNSYDNDITKYGAIKYTFRDDFFKK